jgi:hypothetical protein
MDAPIIATRAIAHLQLFKNVMPTLITHDALAIGA